MMEKSIVIWEEEIVDKEKLLNYMKSVHDLQNLAIVEYTQGILQLANEQTYMYIDQLPNIFWKIQKTNGVSTTKIFAEMITELTIWNGVQ